MYLTYLTNGEGTTPAKWNDNFNIVVGQLGEVRMFDINISGAVTKSSLQSQGWAVCDGTTPASQGITGAIIATTPDLTGKFIRGNITSGTTGGSDTHNHQWLSQPAGSDNYKKIQSYDTSGFGISHSYDISGNDTYLTNSSYILKDLYTIKEDSKPPYYELVYFIKVK